MKKVLKEVNKPSESQNQKQTVEAEVNKPSESQNQKQTVEAEVNKPSESQNQKQTVEAEVNKPSESQNQKQTVEAEVNKPSESQNLIVQLEQDVVDLILSDAENINAQIEAEIQKPTYTTLVNQRKEALDRFNTLKTALQAAEKDFLKAENALMSVDNQINIARGGASKLQVGLLRGLVIASGVNAKNLGAVSLIKDGDKHFIKYELK